MLREAVVASLKGDIEKAFEKLGNNAVEVKPDNIAGAVAARWLRLDAEARENTGVMAPSHELRQANNGHIRKRLARAGRIHGPSMESERLVSMGYTNAEKALAANYGAGDVVAFHRHDERVDEALQVQGCRLPDAEHGNAVRVLRPSGVARGGVLHPAVAPLARRALEPVAPERHPDGGTRLAGRPARCRRRAGGFLVGRREA